MNQSPINESKFDFHRRYFSEEYYEIFSIIVKCYKLILENKCQIKNHENEIRDFIFDNYLNNNDFRIKYNFLKYKVEKEPDENKGNVDLKYLTSNSFIDTKAYFIIECKRLENKNLKRKGLNYKYIIDGICRFTSEKYSSFQNKAGMLGFVVDVLDIDENIKNINYLLNNVNESNTLDLINQISIIDNYKYTYLSKHETNENKRQFDIYHLMLDLSNNIK